MVMPPLQTVLVLWPARVSIASENIYAFSFSLLDFSYLGAHDFLLTNSSTNLDSLGLDVDQPAELTKEFHTT
jgi:hypothetical protein